MNSTFDLRQRAEEKAQSRRHDAQALASGTKSREQLKQENGVFAQINARPDFIQFLKR